MRRRVDLEEKNRDIIFEISTGYSGDYGFQAQGRDREQEV